jgi:heme O synthase-like polyprenyltransferase
MVRHPAWCGGIAELIVAVNITAAWVAAVTLISYVLFYTPLKTRSSLSTLVERCLALYRR